MSLKKNHIRSFFLFSFMSFAVSSAFAQVYRCTGASGDTVFSQTPCPTGANQKEVKINPGASSQSPSNKIDPRQSDAKQILAAKQHDADLLALDQKKGELCKPMSEQAVRVKKLELETAIANSSGYQVRGYKILLSYLLQEEQYNQLDQTYERMRQDYLQKLTSRYHEVSVRATEDLKWRFRPGFDWDQQVLPSTGATEWLCRDLNDGTRDSWHKCACKPRQVKPWRQGSLF